MDKSRKHIGLFYTKTYDGASSLVIYIQNIIKGFNRLPDNDKPKITLLYKKESPIDEVKALHYPYMQYQEIKFLKLPVFKRVINKMYRSLLGKNLFDNQNIEKIAFDALYPVWQNNANFKAKKLFYWYIDFIDYHYPQYFAKEELKRSDKNNKKAAKKFNNLVFSSNDAYQDFAKIIPNYKGNVNILKFVSIFNLKEIKKDELLKKYDLLNHYFITPNQFWPHKNHIIILKAAKLLLDKGFTDFNIAFTGKLSSYRDKDYATTLKNYIKDNQLAKYVKFLGFLPRQDQLNLMKYATAIIQPSLFEGWSTLVEEAKALDQYILLSDIPLHKEQINKGCDFFNPNNEHELQALMMKSLKHKEPIHHHYQNNINQFALDLKKIF